MRLGKIRLQTQRTVEHLFSDAILFCGKMSIRKQYQRLRRLWLQTHQSIESGNGLLIGSRGLLSTGE